MRQTVLKYKLQSGSLSTEDANGVVAWDTDDKRTQQTESHPSPIREIKYSSLKNRKRNLMSKSPWNSVSLVLFEAAAADLERHFIQRWNFAVRSIPNALTRPPLLIPLKSIILGCNEQTHGTLEIQVCRSATRQHWSRPRKFHTQRPH